MNNTTNGNTPASSGSDFAKRCLFLRFPLVVLIVAVHSRYSNILLVEDPDSFFNAYVFRNMPHTAVPYFFLMSGFFLTWKLKPSEMFSYRVMLRKKAVSLVLPYFLWNTLWSMLLYLSLLFPKSQVLPSYKYQDMGVWTVLKDIYWKPLDYPLWFLRDLIVFFLVSPVFLWLIDRTLLFGDRMDRRFFGKESFSSEQCETPSSRSLFKIAVAFFLIAFFFLLQMLPLWGGICFFALGMMYGRFRNRLAVLDKYGLLIWVLFLGQGLLPRKYFSWELFIACSLPAYYSLGGLLTKCSERTCRLFSRLGNDTFFIFCFHAPIATTLTRIVVKYHYFHLPQIVGYFAVIATSVLICLFTLYVIRRLFPRFSHLLNGGRTATDSK